MHSKPGLSVLVVALAMLELASCASANKTMKAEPAASATGFLPDASRMTEQRHRFPFHKTWVKSDAEMSKYDEVLVAPVNTSYLIANTGWQLPSPKDQQTLDAGLNDLAEYMKQSFSSAISGDPEKRFRLVEKAGPNTIVLESAITELVPNRPAIGAMGLGGAAAGKLAVSIGAKATKEIGDFGTIAIESRLRDGASGDIVVMMADRESTKSAPVDLQSLTWYGFAKEIIDDWSRQFVELANTPRSQQVKDTQFFRLKPW